MNEFLWDNTWVALLVMFEGLVLFIAGIVALATRGPASNKFGKAVLAVIVTHAAVITGGLVLFLVVAVLSANNMAHTGRRRSYF